MKQLSLPELLKDGLETVVRNGNSWWRGEPIAELPVFRRWAFEPVYHRFRSGKSCECTARPTAMFATAPSARSPIGERTR
jgi:hypothetical protein